MLVDRQKQAQMTARVLMTTTASLLERTRTLRDEATRLRLEAGQLRIARRVPCRLDQEAWFTVRGLVDGVPSTAHWSPSGLDCDREIARRAEIVVALGETFTHDGVPGAAVAASLEGPPLAVLLTIMRAFSLVTAVDVSFELIGEN